MRLRDILKAAREQGWRHEETATGYMLYPPDPEQTPVTVGRNAIEGDGRAHQNTLADLRRAGFVVPGEQNRSTRRLPVPDSEEHEMAGNNGHPSRPDPLAALRDEVQVEEAVEITRTRRVAIWTPTLLKLLRAYLQEKAPISDDAICDIEMQIDEQGTVRRIPLDRLQCLQVKVVTIEQAEGNTATGSRS